MPGLIRLIYVSRASFSNASRSSYIEPTIARILLQSRRNNPRDAIGGVLYYGDGCFFQVLEGSIDKVNGLVARLMRDRRHHDLQILSAEPIRQRLFRNWSMKYIAVEEQVEAVLERHGQARFVPYEFSPELIGELVHLFARLTDPNSPPDQHYLDHPNAPRGWRRVFARLGLFA